MRQGIWMAPLVRFVALVVWVGGAVFTGAVAVPLAFALLPAGDAGAYTAALFRAVGWVSLPAAALYLFAGDAPSRRGPRLWLTLAAVLLFAAAVFGGGAAMEAVREAQGPGQVPGWLHRVASAGYVAATLCALALVWLEARAGRASR